MRHLLRLIAICPLAISCLGGSSISNTTYTEGTTHSTLSNSLTNVLVPNIIPECVLGVNSVKLDVFTREDPSGFVVPVNKTYCPATKKAFFLIHGFISEANTTKFKYLSDMLLEREDSTIYSLDWSKAACNGNISITNLLSYGSAVKNIQGVAEMMCDYLMGLLNDCGLDIKDTKLIGHSLGAQVASRVGKIAQTKYHTQIYRIDALEPAGVGFDVKNHDESIYKTDAYEVRVFHATATIGIYDAVGHVDLYFNGGYLQPGCYGLPSCSHTKIITMYADSVASNCAYIGTKWKPGLHRHRSISDCNTKDCMIVTFDEGYKPGSYYVKTRSTEPYCRNLSEIKKVLNH